MSEAPRPPDGAGPARRQPGTGSSRRSAPLSDPHAPTALTPPSDPNAATRVGSGSSRSAKTSLSPSDPISDSTISPAAARALDAARTPGGRWGDFELQEELGRGGMGVVWRARQVSLDREVALKLMLGGDAEFRARFSREARALAQVDSPHVVKVFFAGVHEEQPYFVMEFLRGTDCSRRLKQGWKPTPAEAADVVRQAALGLQGAAECGITHRDIKPGNLMITERGVVKLMDFGLVRLEQDRELTTSGVVMGTVNYFSPEQAQGVRCDQRSDIYSLGVVFFQLLTLRLPFQGDNAASLLYHHAHTEPPRPRSLAPAVPPGHEAVVLKCLRKDPAQRYQTAAELAEDIVRLTRGERPLAVGDRSRGRARAVAAAGAAALAVAAGAWWWSTRTPAPAQPPSAATTATSARTPSSPTPPPAAPTVPADTTAPAAGGSAIATETTRTDASTHAAPETVAESPPASSEPSEPIATDPAAPVASEAVPRDPEPVAPQEPDPIAEAPVAQAPASTTQQPEPATQQAITATTPPPQPASTPPATPAPVEPAPAAPAPVAQAPAPAPAPAAPVEQPPPTPPGLGAPVKDAHGWRAELSVRGRAIAFRWCPPGNFQMGLGKGGAPDERPQHAVRLTRGFWLAERELSEGDLAALSGEGDASSAMPAHNLSRSACEKIAADLNHGVQGLGARLPSEAEWEYACRAGADDRPKADAATAWHDHDEPRAVGTLRPNAWGLHDMLGNVREWCSDSYGDYPAGEAVDPRPRDDGKHGVARGGGWEDVADDCRATKRFKPFANRKDRLTGLRITLDAPSDQRR